MADSATQENTTNEKVQEKQPAQSRGAAARPQASGNRFDRGGSREGDGNRRNQRSRRTRKPRERARPEYEQKIVAIRRVTRVVAGGRRFSFSVAMVIGNGKGDVGVGLGKASDTALAIEKAMRNAKKRLVRVPMTEDLSIKHEVRAKFGSSEILLIPAPGKGLKAGSAVRTVLELAGVKHISGKILTRSKNHYNNALATLKALQKLS